MWPFKKKVEQKQEAPLKENPKSSLIFQVDDDGNLSVMCAWPRPDTSEEAMETVARVAKMIFLTTSGHLLGATLHAIANNNNQDKLYYQMSKSIISATHSLMENNGVLNLPNDDKPVIAPHNCFNVRGGDDD